MVSSNGLNAIQVIWLSGRLFIVSTPIGNLGDISQRLKDVLAECDLVLAEDTRVTIKILNHIGMKKRLISCHKFNEQERANILQQAARQDESIALISDAGTPLVSDPGERIVNNAIELGMDVIPIPGPSAVLAALVASGFSGDRFTFEGFLPENQRLLNERLNRLKDDDRTLVIYIAPHKLERTVDAVAAVLGDRRCCLARELTKKFEQFIRMTLLQLSKYIEENQLKGEMVLVVEGASEARTSLSSASEKEVMAFVNDEIGKGTKLSEACSLAAKLFGGRKADIYKLAVSQIKGDS